ncbi:MAG: putative ABC transporter-binding protein [Synechococcus sp. CC9902]|nr:MAG: putative ABC transporter-binding protein [Synechococcus sp. CC9902]
MRRLLLTLIGLLLAGSIGWSGLQRPEEISILMPAPFADATVDQVKQFNADHSGRIVLNVIRGPRDTESISDLAISSLLLGTPPFDALLVDVTWLPKYVAADWLQPLDPWFDDADVDALVAGARLGNSVNGDLYRWPFGADVGLLYWRKDLMPEPPRTASDLIQIASRLRADGKVKEGFVWQGRQYEGLSCNFVEFLSAFGGTWLDPVTGQPELDSKAARATVHWMQQLIREGTSPLAVSNYAEPETLQAFKAGDAALMRNWPYAWAELQSDSSAVKGRVGVTTMVAEPGASPAATLGSWGFSLLRGSQHQQATAEAIRALTSSQAQRDRFLQQGYTPTEASLFEDPELLEASPVLTQLKEALAIAVPRPITPLYAQMSDLLQRQLSGVLTEKRDPDQAMEQLQGATITLLRSAGGES